MIRAGLPWSALPFHGVAAWEVCEVVVVHRRRLLRLAIEQASATICHNPGESRVIPRETLGSEDGERPCQKNARDGPAGRRRKPHFEFHEGRQLPAAHYSSGSSIHQEYGSYTLAAQAQNAASENSFRSKSVHGALEQPLRHPRLLPCGTQTASGSGGRGSHPRPSSRRGSGRRFGSAFSTEVFCRARTYKSQLHYLYCDSIDFCGECAGSSLASLVHLDRANGKEGDGGATESPAQAGRSHGQQRRNSTSRKKPASYSPTERQGKGRPVRHLPVRWSRSWAWTRLTSARTSSTSRIHPTLLHPPRPRCQAAAGATRTAAMEGLRQRT
jgi:hypothetical protein